MSYYNCYFSPTGGTKKVADAVASGWGEAFTPVDLLRGDEEITFTAEDICLVAVPSYGGRVPAPVADHLGKWDGNGARAVLIAVFGNRAIDDTLLELSDLLTAAGFHCIAAMEAVAQHSLMAQFGKGRPDADDLSQLQGYAQQIRTALEGGTLPAELHLPGSRPYREYHGVPLKPSVANGCIACGKCAAECPVGAIPLNNVRTTDRKKCISCMHCVAICPKHVRHVSRLMTTVASTKMKKTCSDRKPNQLYL